MSYKPLHLEAQQRLQEEGCVVDITMQPQEVAGRISGAVAGEIYAKSRHTKYPS